MTSPRKSEIEKRGSKRWACSRNWGEKSLTSGRRERAPERLEQQEGAAWGKCERRAAVCGLLLRCCTQLWDLQKVKVLVPQSCLTLCYARDYSPPSSSVHGILQARILEWVAIPFSRGPSQPRDRTQVSCMAGRFFIIWTTRVLWRGLQRATL